MMAEGERAKERHFTQCEVEILVDEVDQRLKVLIGGHGRDITNARKASESRCRQQRCLCCRQQRVGLWLRSRKSGPILKWRGNKEFPSTGKVRVTQDFINPKCCVENDVRLLLSVHSLHK